MAVPGSVLNGRHGGCHGLVRDGAALVETGADILAALDVPGALRNPGGPSAVPPAGDPLVDRMCAGETYDLDDLCALSGAGAVSLLSRLLELELRGAVRRVGGGRFVRSGGSC
jgi:DNA processing protein